MWFTFRVEATSTELCLLCLERVHSSAATYCAARDLMGKSALTAGSPSLLDLFSFSIFPSYNILSLSLCQSLRIVTCMLYEPATGYSKIITVNNRTRARLLQLSDNLQNN